MKCLVTSIYKHAALEGRLVIVFARFSTLFIGLFVSYLPFEVFWSWLGSKRKMLAHLLNYSWSIFFCIIVMNENKNNLVMTSFKLLLLLQLQWNFRDVFLPRCNYSELLFTFMSGSADFVFLHGVRKFGDVIKTFATSQSKWPLIARLREIGRKSRKTKRRQTAFHGQKRGKFFIDSPMIFTHFSRNCPALSI